MPRLLPLYYLSLALLCTGILAVTSRLSDPFALKPLLITAGLAGLALPALIRRNFPWGTVPFLLFWLYAYFRLTGTIAAQASAAMHAGVFFAFVLGYLRTPLKLRWVVPALVLLCVGRGVFDLVTLSPLGGWSAETAPLGTVASFFGNKHFFGGLLILGAFHQFYLMEKGEPHKPVQVLLYCSTALVLLSLLLTDSRLAQGVFFLCFLPLLFLSLRLDGKEPALERIAWITGITLCLGLVWINLPEKQWLHTATVLSPSAPDNVVWAWGAAWRVFRAHPWFGCGLGGFRFAAVDYMGSRPLPADDTQLPPLAHAGNHLLESLAETGLIGIAMEITIAIVALAGMAWFYYREWRIEAKYGFFCIVALALTGEFCPILETAPGRFLYWGLLGYGFSLAVEAFAFRLGIDRARPSPRAARVFGIAISLSMLALSTAHVVRRSIELKSDWLSARAHGLIASNPKASTDLLVEALRIDPGNEDANYEYTEVLGHFGRLDDALKRLSYIQTFAPDPVRYDEALSSLYREMGNATLAAYYANRVLGKHPNHLASLEILFQSWMSLRACDLLDEQHEKNAGLANVYPLPLPSAYTVEALDSLFGSNQDLNFVQRWFGGKALKKRFVERQQLAYNRRLENHTRAEALTRLRCPVPDDTTAPARQRAKPPPEHRLYHKWRGIG